MHCIRSPAFSDSTAILGIVNGHLPDDIYGTFEEDDSEFAFSFERIEIRFKVDLDGIVANVIDKDGRLARRIIDPIRQSVRHAIEDSSDGKSVYGIAVALLKAIEAAYDFEVVSGAKGYSNSRSIVEHRKTEIQDWQEVLQNPVGVDSTSTRELIYHILKKTPEQIVEKIPSYFRVRHVEPVLRQDLARQFLKHQAMVLDGLKKRDPNELRAKLPPSEVLDGKVRSSIPIEHIIDEMVRPRVFYYATPLHTVSSIVQNGFKDPGSKVEVCTNAFFACADAKGCHKSEPSLKADTPLAILPSIRVIVCAGVLGRCDNWQIPDWWYPISSPYNVRDLSRENYESSSSHTYAYTIFSDQVLPCYVIDLDLGAAVAVEVIDEAQKGHLNYVGEYKPKLHPRLQKTHVAPGDAKRDQERKKAAGMKWFSNGVGPAKGTRFKVEEVGKIDDDEEDYGNWQEERHVSYGSAGHS